MKLIKNQIVVELPKEEYPKEQCRSWNDALSEVAKMNPVIGVDAEELSYQIFLELPNLNGSLSINDMNKLASALASNPSAWMKRKK